MTLVPDWGERYLTRVFDDDWMRKNGFLGGTCRSTVLDVVKAKDGRVSKLVKVEPTTPIRMVLSAITAHDIGQIPVVRGGQCMGSITEARMMTQIIEDPELLDKPVETVMGAPFPVLDSHVDSAQIRPLLTRGNPACVVCDNNNLIGIITRYDGVRAITT